MVLTLLTAAVSTRAAPLDSRTGDGFKVGKSITKAAISSDIATPFQLRIAATFLLTNPLLSRLMQRAPLTPACGRTQRLCHFGVGINRLP
jgi:hypothetical protein